MRIYKGSETTLKLPIHICGTDSVNIDRVILYTTDANQAITINDVYITDETLNVRITDKTFDLMEDGVINYIAEGKTTHFERQSSYYLKTPKDYIAISLDTQDKDVTVTKNNTTTVIKPDEGYVGLDEVRVYTDISLEENKSYEFTENDTSFDIVPDEGYDGIKSGKVSVNIPIQDRSETYTDNGTYEVIPDYGLMSHVEVIVDVPLEYGKQMYATTNNTAVEIEPSSGYKGVRQGKVYVEIPTQDEKTVNIVKNGTTEVLPDEGYHYIRKVNINTDVTLNSTPIVPSQISFDGSTWEEFDMEPYDWKYVYNWSGMFTECRNLKRVLNFPQYVTPHHHVYNMFYYCSSLEEAPYFDMNEIVMTNNMFRECSSLTTIPSYDMSNVMFARNMFYACSSLTTIPYLNCEKLISATEMFVSCRSLTNVGGFGDIKCSLALNDCYNLTTQSIVNIIEGLYDFDYWAEEPDSTQGTLTLSKYISSSVTDELMAKATSKKWNIIFK